MGSQRVWSGLACTQIALPGKGGHSSFLPLKNCVPTWEDLMRSLIAIKLFYRRFLHMVQTVKCLCLQCGRPRFDPWVRKILWRRIWRPTPVFLPGKSHGQRSVVGYIPWGHKESDMTEQLHFNSSSSRVGLLRGLGWVENLHSFNMVSGNLMSFCDSFNLAPGGLLEELLWFLSSGMKNADIFHFWGVLVLHRAHQYLCPLRQNQDHAPRLHYRFLTVSPLPLHPLLPLISKGWNQLFGT